MCRRRVHAALVATLSLAAGCEFNCSMGGISKDKVEASVREEIAKYVDEEFTVTCPAIKKDAVTDCSVKLASAMAFVVQVTTKGSDATYESQGVAFGRVLGPKIATGLKEQFSLEVDTVSCPPVMPAHDGAQAACEAKANELVVPIAVTFKEAGNYSFKPTAGIVIAAKAEQFIVGQFARRNIKVTAKCGPPEIRLSLPGSKFECQATDTAGESRPIYFSITSTDGDVDLSLTPPVIPSNGL